MSNEELAVLVQDGDRERLMELWEQVQRLVWKKALRWEAVAKRNGMEIQDLLQVGAVAVMRAAYVFDGSKNAKYTTILDFYLKSEFTNACGQRTDRTKRDPLHSAASLDAPLTDDEGDPLTLADTLLDPAAEAAMQSVEEQDWTERRRSAVEAAIATLSDEQQAAIRRRYYEVQPLLQTRYSDTTAHAAALRLLRHPSRSRALMEYA